mmetsp:Transcript_7136/g.16328  ORF Transcript_7136/g.16328 Transcript_7136/m.16328 type:complete len:222 (-) Transcript_7136:53-718(-)
MTGPRTIHQRVKLEAWRRGVDGRRCFLRPGPWAPPTEAPSTPRATARAIAAPAARAATPAPMPRRRRAGARGRPRRRRRSRGRGGPRAELPSPAGPPAPRPSPVGHLRTADKLDLGSLGRQRERASDPASITSPFAARSTVPRPALAAGEGSARLQTVGLGLGLGLGCLGGRGFETREVSGCLRRAQSRGADLAHPSALLDRLPGRPWVGPSVGGRFGGHS